MSRRAADALAKRCLWPGEIPEPEVDKVVDGAAGALCEDCRREVAALEAAALREIRAGEARANDNESVYVGGPGVAYMFVKAAALTQDAGCIAAASAFLDPWRQRVARQQEEDPALSCSLLCGQAGWLCVEALRAHVAGDRPAAAGAAAAYAGLARGATPKVLDADEWLYGRAGYLHGCLLLEHVLGQGAVPENVVPQVAADILASGKAYAATARCGAPLLWRWYGEEYLGAAHGVFGILHMLLHVNLCEADKGLVVQTLDWLVSGQTESGNWPATRGEREDSLVHFCHGAPGAVLALCCAHERLGGTKYLEAALRAGECVWRYGLLKKGPGICHGAAGNGYAFLALFRVTGEPRWLARAHAFSALMLRPEVRRSCRQPDHPLSLYEGLAGTVCFLLDLRLRPKQAAFPLFELGGLA